MNLSFHVLSAITPSYGNFIFSLSESVSLLVVSNSLRPHELWPTRILCPWDFPSKGTEILRRLKKGLSSFRFVKK